MPKDCFLGVLSFRRRIKNSHANNYSECWIHDLIAEINRQKIGKNHNVSFAFFWHKWPKANINKGDWLLLRTSSDYGKICPASPVPCAPRTWKYAIKLESSIPRNNQLVPINTNNNQYPFEHQIPQSLLNSGSGVIVPTFWTSRDEIPHWVIATEIYEITRDQAIIMNNQVPRLNQSVIVRNIDINENSLIKIL